MLYSTIALDLDGTLFNSDGEISPKNRAAVAYGAAHGLRIVLCTGRHHFDASWVAGQLGVVIYAASSNGAYLVDSADKPCFAGPMERDLAIETGEAIRISGLCPIFYLENGILIDSSSPMRSWYEQRNDHLGGRLHLIVEENIIDAVKKRNDRILKIAVNSFDSDPFPRLEEEFDSRGIEWTHSSRFNREITAPGVSKVVAIEHAMKLLGTTLDDLVAVGDSMNDMQIIRAAGCGIAMGNACDELKSAADGVCPPNTEDGVADTIYRILDGTLVTDALRR